MAHCVAQFPDKSGAVCLRRLLPHEVRMADVSKFHVQIKSTKLGLVSQISKFECAGSIQNQTSQLTVLNSHIPNLTARQCDDDDGHDDFCTAPPHKENINCRHAWQRVALRPTTTNHRQAQNSASTHECRQSFFTAGDPCAEHHWPTS